MKTQLKKYVGIFMDHSAAHLIEFGAEHNEAKIILSKFTHSVKEDTLSKSENLMHHKEQHQMAEFYKEIGEAVRYYDKVLLFGPTNAKLELLNILKKDQFFVEVNFVVKDTDKMIDKDQRAFVKDYFQNHL